MNYISTNIVMGNPMQPRQIFHESYLEELAQSIIANGQMQAGEIIPIRNIIGEINFPIPQGCQYMVISGESRLRACQKANLDYKAVILEQKLTMNQILVRALTENEVRRDPNPIENARAYQSLMNTGYTIDDLKRETGKNRTYIEGRLALLTLNAVCQTALIDGMIGLKQAIQLARLKDTEQGAVLDMIAKGKIKNLQQTINAVDYFLNKNNQQSFFSIPQTKVATKRNIRKMAQIMKSVQRSYTCFFNRKAEICIPDLTNHEYKKVITQLKLVEKTLKQVSSEIERRMMIEQFT